MACNLLLTFCLFLLGPIAFVYAQQKSFYGGVFTGACGQNGIYYKDSKGFMICSNNYGYYMRCPTGTRNPPESAFEAGSYYTNSDFCGIIVDIFGKSRDDFLGKEAEDTKALAKTVGGTQVNSVHPRYQARSGAPASYYKQATTKSRPTAQPVHRITLPSPPNGHFVHAVHKQKPVERKNEQKHNGNYHKSQTQTHKSPESYLRKVLEVSKSTRNKNQPQGHESSYKTTVSEHMEMSSKSAKQTNSPLHVKPSKIPVHHTNFIKGQAPQEIAKSIEVGLKETMSKILEESKKKATNKSPDIKPTRSATTHTYHHPGGIVRTYESAMFHPPGRSNLNNVGQQNPAVQVGALATAPASIPQFPFESNYAFPSHNNFGNTAANFGNPYASHYANQPRSYYPQSSYGSPSNYNAQQHNHQNLNYGQQQSNGQNQIPNGNTAQNPSFVQAEQPKPYDPNNYLHVDFYGRSGENYQQTLPYLPGAFDSGYGTPKSNRKHHVYQTSVKESYSVNMESKPETSQTNIISEEEPSHVHSNTPYPFPREALNLNQNHVDFEKYSSQFGYRPYYGIHQNQNGRHQHHQIPQLPSVELRHQPKFLPIEGRQAALPGNSLGNNVAPTPTSHGTKSFMKQKSEFMNINGKTVKDYSSTVYGVHAV